MAKQVKCKKCKLTYDKKKYECPYCHTKRFNPTGLIVFFIILLLGAGAIYYFFGDKITEYIKEDRNDISNNSGLIFNNLSITPSLEKENIYIVNFDIVNSTESSLNKKYMLINLADKVRAPVTEGKYIIWDNDYEILDLQMLSEEIYKAEYEIKIEREWDVLEIYLRELKTTSEETEEMKIFTYKNGFEKSETETTPDINIITE